jgi:hypothetical protein
MRLVLVAAAITVLFLPPGFTAMLVWAAWTLIGRRSRLGL